jgi:hypothetical protein
MTFFERHILRHGHPRHMIVGALTTVWTSYFFWQHEFVYGISVLGGGLIIARLVTWGMHEEELANTTLGKILLLHLHPMNVLLQTLGVFILFVGFWEHSSMYLMFGTSLILLGHMWGWHKVHQAL